MPRADGLSGASDLIMYVARPLTARGNRSNTSAKGFTRRGVAPTSAIVLAADWISCSTLTS